MTRESGHDGCYRALRPFRLCEAPAGLSLFSQRVRIKLTTNTQGYTPQRLARSFVLRLPLHGSGAPLTTAEGSHCASSGTKECGVAAEAADHSSKQHSETEQYSTVKNPQTWSKLWLKLDLTQS